MWHEYYKNLKVVLQNEFIYRPFGKLLWRRLSLRQDQIRTYLNNGDKAFGEMRKMLDKLDDDLPEWERFTVLFIFLLERTLDFLFLIFVSQVLTKSAMIPSQAWKSTVPNRERRATKTNHRSLRKTGSKKSKACQLLSYKCTDTNVTKLSSQPDPKLWKLMVRDYYGSLWYKREKKRRSNIIRARYGQTRR